MKTRPKAPPLSALVAADVAENVTRALIDHFDQIRRTLIFTHPLNTFHVDLDNSPIVQHVWSLVQFAQTGQRHSIDPKEVLKLLAEVYYGSADHGCSGLLGDQGTALGVAYLAATARLAIAAGEPVEPRALASLAGVHPSRVRALCAKLGGKKPVLQRSMKTRGAAGWKITATSAKAWLRGLEISGLGDGEPDLPGR